MGDLGRAGGKCPVISGLIGQAGEKVTQIGKAVGCKLGLKMSLKPPIFTNSAKHSRFTLRTIWPLVESLGTSH